MSTLPDIYDPPPAPVAWSPPEVEPIRWTSGDLACLAALIAPLLAAAAWTWSYEPTVSLWLAVGGTFVILESWFSALTFLHRHPSARPGGRWIIFLAALVPWLLGLGFATLLILGLFLAS